MAHGKAAQRDIVQFVPYRKFKNVSFVLIIFYKPQLVFPWEAHNSFAWVPGLSLKSK